MQTSDKEDKEEVPVEFLLTNLMNNDATISVTFNIGNGETL